VTATLRRSLFHVRYVSNSTLIMRDQSCAQLRFLLIKAAWSVGGVFVLYWRAVFGVYSRGNPAPLSG